MRAGFLDARPCGRKKPGSSSAPVSAPPDATSWRSRAPGATRAFLDAACAERWKHGHEVVSPPEASSSPSENLLVLLHGRGERSAAPFAAFARKLNLPHTTCLSLAGPSPLPFGVPGREWFARLDPETGEDLRNDANPNHSHLRADSLRRTQKALDYLLDKLTDVTQGGWPSTSVHLFGFSDGGTVAIEIGVARVGQRRLGGCVTVSAALLPENVKRASILYPPEARAPTPFALTCGVFDTVVPRTAVEETARVLLSRNPGAVAETFVCLEKNTHATVNGEDETRFLMRFWGGTLSSPRMCAEDIGTDVLEITNETVELSKLTKAVSSEPQ